MKRSIAAVLSVMMGIGAVTAAGSIGDVNAVYAASVDAPSNISVSADKTSITLKWDEEPGAAAYRIYQYDASTKKFVKIKTITGTSTKITGLKEGKKYYFKVASLVKSGGSYKVAGTSAKISATPKAKKTGTTANKAKTDTNKNKTNNKNNGALPKLPRNVDTSFRESGSATTLIRNKFDEDFEGVRFKIVALGYQIKPTDNKSDNDGYVGEYEVRYDGKHVYNFYEKYVFTGTGGSGDGWVWMEDLAGNVVWGSNRTTVTRGVVQVPRFDGITTTSFSEYGNSQSDVETKLYADFEKIRFGIVAKGYTIKPLTSNNDGGYYLGAYEVRYDGKQVYTYYESFNSYSTYGNGWVWLEDMSKNIVVGSTSYGASTAPYVIYSF